MRRNKFIIFVLVLVVIISILIYNNFGIKQICIKNKACFNAEIADTDEKKILGLGNRDFLEESGGMLFPYPEKSAPGFWMKNMRFPIDIIWINPEMRVSGIVNDFQPCESDEVCPVIYPDEEIIYVFEINSGLSDRHDLENGDLVYFR